MHPLPAIERVFAVAINTTQRATRQADKHRRQTGLHCLALQGMENLGDFQHTLAGFGDTHLLFDFRRHNMVFGTAIEGSRRQMAMISRKL